MVLVLEYSKSLCNDFVLFFGTVPGTVPCAQRCRRQASCQPGVLSQCSFYSHTAATKHDGQARVVAGAALSAPAVPRHRRCKARQARRLVQQYAAPGSRPRPPVGQLAAQQLSRHTEERVAAVAFLPVHEAHR